MIIYNVTVKIDHEVHDEWLQWMTAKHIPEVMATGYFLESKMFKLIDPEMPDGVSYAIQYSSANQEDIEEYQQKCAPKLQKEHNDKYMNKFVAFRTLLELVN